MDITCPHCGSLFGVADQQRSDAKHRLYMACVKLAFDMLPEHLHGIWANDTALRYWALRKTGWYIEKIYQAESKAEANRIASWLSAPNMQIEVKGKQVTVRQARSQRYGEMGKKDFDESSEAVLLELSKLIGTDVVTLRTEGLSYSIPS